MTLSYIVDLQNIFDYFNPIFFNNALHCSIRWGKRYNKLRRRIIRLGSFNTKTNTIRINPALNSDEIPSYVIRYVVYHEMAHAWCLNIDPDMRFHNGEFKQKERLFPEFDQARKWLDENKTVFFAKQSGCRVWPLFR